MKKALIFALAFYCLTLRLSPLGLAQDNGSPTPVSVATEGGSREQDKLNGPVRRVRVETTKIVLKNGNWIEGPREVLGVATYDPTGKKIDFVAYPVEASALPGKEQYLYDDKGNVVEMILIGSDGSMLSKEAYNYEFDQLGNWTKRTSSVAVFENGKIGFEPTGITYRTISYYYNQAIEKLNVTSPKSRDVLARNISSTPSPNPNGSITDSPRTSTASNPSTQPLVDRTNAHAKRETVTAPASIAPAKSGAEALDSSAGPATNGTANPESPVAAASTATPDEVVPTTVVQHVPEEDLLNAAIELPKPEYSEAALLARAGGKVKVQILVDETGHVTNAQSTSGHPLLGAAAEAAARKARFSLTKLAPGATRVYGVISYDFVPPIPTGEVAPADSPAIDRNPPKPEESKAEETPIPENAAAVESKSEAAADYTEAARSFYNKGVTFQASGQYSEAADAFNRAIKIYPNDANAYARLGMAYSAMQKHKDAVVVYKMALQTNRRALGADAYYMWGHSYLALDKTSDALSAFKQALYIKRAESIDPDRKDSPRYPSLEQLHYSMGLAYLNSRRFANSIDELKKVVKLNPKNAEAYYTLAIAYLSNGDRRQAEILQKTLATLDADLAKKIKSSITVEGLPPGCRTIACR